MWHNEKTYSISNEYKKKRYLLTNIVYNKYVNLQLSSDHALSQFIYITIIRVVLTKKNIYVHYYIKKYNIARKEVKSKKKEYCVRIV